MDDIATLSDFHAFEKYLATVTKSMRLAREAGVPASFYQRIIDEPEFRTHLAEFTGRHDERRQNLWKVWQPRLLDREDREHRIARAIMGEKFLGIPECVALFGPAPSERTLPDLRTIPFSRDELERLRHDHLLVADFGISLKMLLAHASMMGQPLEMTATTGALSGSVALPVSMTEFREPARWRMIRIADGLGEEPMYDCLSLREVLAVHVLHAWRWSASPFGRRISPLVTTTTHRLPGTNGGAHDGAHRACLNMAGTPRIIFDSRLAGQECMNAVQVSAQ